MLRRSMKTLWLVLSVGNLAKALMEVRARLRAGDRSGERPAFSGIFIVGALSQYVQTYLVELLHGFVQMNMTEGLLGHLLRNPVSYFAKRQVGDLFARVKAQDDLLSATRQAGAAARESGSRFRAGVARIESLTRLVQTSRASLAATQMGYKVGSRASTDVLRAADVFYTNRRDLNLI